MSGGYADRLKHYPNKGVCGLPENYDSERLLKANLRSLVELVRDAKHLVIMTGAGISTSAGIPDFRGPNGIWTVQKAKDQEAKNEKKRLKQERDEAEHRKKPRSGRNNKLAEQVAQLRNVVGDGGDRSVVAVAEDVGDAQRVGGERQHEDGRGVCPEEGAVEGGVGRAAALGRGGGLLRGRRELLLLLPLARARSFEPLL